MAALVTDVPATEPAMAVSLSNGSSGGRRMQATGRRPRIPKSSAKLHNPGYHYIGFVTTCLTAVNGHGYRNLTCSCRSDFPDS